MPAGAQPAFAWSGDPSELQVSSIPLYRLEECRVRSECGTHRNNREAKYYHLTPAGKRALGAEVDTWRNFVDAVELVLETSA